MLIGRKPIKFQLKKEFKDELKQRKVNWGFGGLSEFTFYRTYSRKKENEKMETWADCVIRVIEGMFSILKTHCLTSHMPWDERKAHKLAKEAAERLFEFKWTPPGRGLFQMGTDYVWERGSMSLYNCSFVSTEDIDFEMSKPFAFAMDVLMCGVGCGYDTLGADKIIVNKPEGELELIVVEDTREGWVEAISCLIDSYFEEGSAPILIDTSEVRAYGEAIKGFGGVASGPEPLEQGFEGIKDILNKRDGELIQASDIVDIMNLIGKLVVAGNVRRCLPSDANIQTENGFKTIKELTLQDKIVTGGKSYKILEKLNSGKQKILSIKHRFGTLDCTPDHRVAVFTEVGNYKFKPAKDLVIGDRLVWDSIGYEGKEQDLPLFEEKLHFNAKPFTIPEKLNPDISWLIGMVHGDGYVGPGEIEIAAASHELENLRKAQNIFENYFGLTSKITKIKDKNCYRLRLHSAGLARWFGKHVKKSDQQLITIPSFIKAATRDNRFSYLAGLFDADGRYRSDGVLEQCATIYPNLKKDVVSLLASLGIGVVCSFHDQKHKVKKGYNKKDYYSIRIVGNTNKEKWVNNIQLYSVSEKIKEISYTSSVDFSYPVSMFNKKPDGYKPHGSILISSPLIKHSVYLPTPITEITVKEKTETYDIEIEEAKQFTTDGIVVHNSALLALGKNERAFVELKNWEKYAVEMGSKAPKELLELNPEDYHKYNDGFSHRKEIAEKYSDQSWAYKFGGYRWCSNNSIYGYVGMDYSEIAEDIAINGEPGVFWIENARSYGRLKDGIKNDDRNIKGVNPCLSGDTRIATADGRNFVSIKELAEEGKNVPVYCINDLGQIVISEGINPRITGKNKQLYKITLEDGTNIRATENHEFFNPNGQRIQLKDLSVGDSIMHRVKWNIYRNKKKQQYTMISKTKTNYHRGEHRLIAEYHLGRNLNSDEVVHHIDHNGLNNNWNNLEVMTEKEHNELHSNNMMGKNNPYFRMSDKWKENFHRPKYGEENGMYGKNHSEKTKKLIGQKAKERWKDPIFREKCTNVIKQNMKREEVKQKLSEAMKKRHKKCEIIIIEEDEINDVLENENLNWTSSGKLFYVRKIDPIDGEEFIVPFGDRHKCTRNPENGYKFQAISANKTKHAIANDKILSSVEEIKKYIVNNKKIPTGKDIMKLINKLGFDYRITSDTHKIKNPKDYLYLICKEVNLDPSVINMYKLKNTDYNKKVTTSILESESFSYNHKIINIEKDTVEDVYCLTVPEFSNFCVITETKPTKEGLKRFNLIPVSNCSEIELQSYEVCNLNENYPAKHENYWDFQRTLKFSYLYSKAVTILSTQWPETNAVVAGNRRIGCSVSGIQEAFIRFGRTEFLDWLDRAYDYINYVDKKYSDWLGIPKSIRKTCIKPSGSVSLLAGSLPGIHHPEGTSYYRTVRVAANSDLVQILAEAGYRIEAAASDPLRTVVVYFPVLHDEDHVSKKEVSIWRQFKDTADIQRYFTDNMVSVTVTFNKEEANQIAECLSAFERELKSISLLPYSTHGYEQAPYIEAPREEIIEYKNSLKPLDFSALSEEDSIAVEANKFCTNEECSIL